MISQDVFERHVRDALNNLYDPFHLQTHPLVGVFGLPGAPGQTAGESLREMLWEAVSSLQPDPSISASRPEWICYRLIWMHCFQGLDMATICGELGLSERSFYRRLREGIEAVASVLYARYESLSRAAHASSLGQGADDQTRAAEEAARLARTSRRQEVDICAVLSDALNAVEALAAQKGVVVEVACPSSLPPAHGDPALFHQVIVDLLTEGIGLANAGPLHLSVGEARDGTLWALGPVHHALPGQVDASAQSGLAVCRALLDAYGGRLSVEAGPGGSSFQLSIPRARTPSVLIIDDSETTVDLYRRYLDAKGIPSRSAGNGDQVDIALEEELPSVILLDVLMPQENGWELLQRLKTLPETRSIPVIICSVISQPSLAMSLGAARVLRKPISQRALLSTIDGVLAAK